MRCACIMSFIKAIISAFPNKRTVIDFMGALNFRVGVGTP